jgi:hypothetical protein
MRIIFAAVGTWFERFIWESLKSEGSGFKSVIEADTSPPNSEPQTPRMCKRDTMFISGIVVKTNIILSTQCLKQTFVRTVP